MPKLLYQGFAGIIGNKLKTPKIACFVLRKKYVPVRPPAYSQYIRIIFDLFLIFHKPIFSGKLI